MERVDEEVLEPGVDEDILPPIKNTPRLVRSTGEDPELVEERERIREEREAWQRLTPDERQIKIWKTEILGFKHQGRRGRYEIGKRLAAIQAARAKAHVGTFTKDLKALKIGIPAAYAHIKFYKKLEELKQRHLLQFAKAEEKFPGLEDVEAFDQRMADAEVAALNAVIEEEDKRISALRNTKNAHPTDYKLTVECGAHKRRERFKAKWLSADEKLRSAAVYKIVMDLPDTDLPMLPLPFTYGPDYQTKEESTELVAYFDTLAFDVRKTRWGKEIKRQSLGYIAKNAFNDRKDWGTKYADIETAPEIIQRFRRKLAAHTGQEINYISILKYPNSDAIINWHNHAEDQWHDSPVWDVTVGPTERRFWAREITNPKTTVTSVLAEVGSLITLPASMNHTHEHAILKDKTTGIRYSINCKSLPLTGVWDCHQGKNYPKRGVKFHEDAVYVGCRVCDRRGNVIREGTIFGNGTNPLVSHDGALKTEREFREYAERRMQDPGFRAEVEKLRGKHLLCWCVQTGPKRAEFCHARIWLEIANRDPHATNPSE